MLALARSVPWRLTRASFVATDLFLHSRRVFTRSGGDGDQFTFLDERGDPKDIAGFNRGRLRIAARRVPFDPDVSFDDPQINEIGQINPNGLIPEEQNFHVLVLF